MSIKYVSKNTLDRVVANINDQYAKKTDLAEYSVAAQTTEDGFASTYQLTKNGSPVGAKINIPKDIFVQDVSQTPVTVTENDKPVAGYKVGDKYIDFTIATSKDDSKAQHLYLLVSDLCDEYLGDELSIHLDTTTNKFSLKLDSTNANGLEVGDNGLKLNLASTTSAGAMSAADKTKLEQALTSDTLAAEFVEITNDEVDNLFKNPPALTPAAPVES